DLVEGQVLPVRQLDRVLARQGRMMAGVLVLAVEALPPVRQQIVDVRPRIVRPQRHEEIDDCVDFQDRHDFAPVSPTRRDVSAERLRRSTPSTRNGRNYRIYKDSPFGGIERTIEWV